MISNLRPRRIVLGVTTVSLPRLFAVALLFIVWSSSARAVAPNHAPNWGGGRSDVTYNVADDIGKPYSDHLSHTQERGLDENIDVVRSVGQVFKAAGSVSTVIKPKDAKRAGARWRVDGGSWQKSGATVTGLSAGRHSVSFKNVSGWTAPKNKKVDISVGQTATVSGRYKKMGVIDAPFVALPASGPAPLEVRFKFGSPAEAPRVTSWAWDFDNDGVVDSTDTEPSHVYTAEGRYTASLKISTISGAQGESVQVECVKVRERIETQINDRVLIVDNEPDLTFVSKSDGSLVLDYSGSEQEPIAVGDIIVGTHEDGYARRVLSVAKTDQTLTIATANVALTEIVEKGDISGLTVFTPDDLAKAGFQKSDDGKAKLPFENVEIGAGITLSGNLEIDPSLDWDCRINDDNAVEYFRAAIVGEVKATWDASIGIEGALHKKGEISLLDALGTGKIKKTALYWVGYLPVLITTELDIAAGYDVGVEGSVEFHGGYSTVLTARFGAEYDGGVWNMIRPVDIDAERIGPEYQFAAGGYGKIYLKPKAKLRIYYVVGPSASQELYARVNAKVVPTPELELLAGLKTKVGFSFLDLEPIGLDFDVDFSAEYDGPVFVLGRWSFLSSIPVASTPAFTASAESGIAPLPVQFTDTSDPGSGTITSWNWDFGDRSTSTSQNPLHTFQNPGTYLVRLRIESTSGAADWAASNYINVSSANIAPTAAFRAQPTSGQAPLTVQFTDQSTPGTSPITSWAWDFNNDGTVDSTQQNPQPTFQDAGLYDVKLTVGSASGSDSETKNNYISVTSGNSQIIMLPGNVPLEMVWIPAGSFMMGRYTDEQDSKSDESPQHQVTLANGFWMGKYELTKAQWQAVMNTTPWSGQLYIITDPNSPAVYVTWNNALSFITALNAHITNTGQGAATFRLPSEAQWEYACRAGTTTRFYWGNDSTYTDINNYAWWYGNAYNVSGQQYAHIVGLKTQNGFGLYDMSGNAWEWCEDWWHSTYTGAPTDGSAWVSPTGSTRVGRSGGWGHGDGDYCRSAGRSSIGPSGTDTAVGFRLAR